MYEKKYSKSNPLGHVPLFSSRYGGNGEGMARHHLSGPKWCCRGENCTKENAYIFLPKWRRVNIYM